MNRILSRNLFIGWVWLFWYGQAQADLILTVELVNPVQTATSVQYDLQAAFDGDNPTDRIESIQLELSGSSVELQDGPGGSEFQRFSLTNLDWEAGIDQTFGSIGLDPPPPTTDFLVAGENQLLARMTVNTTGLADGDYTIEIDDFFFAGAIGDFGSGMEDLVLDAGGTFTATGATFTITSVPEPTSATFLLGSILFGLALNRRSRLVAQTFH